MPAIRLASALSPPEPARELTVHLLRAASAGSTLPRWVEQHPITAMSPAARQLAWAVGRRITRNPDHGFAIGERVPAHAVGSLWPLYQAAPDLAAIYGAYPRIAVLMLDDTSLHIEAGPHAVRISFTPAEGLLLDRAEEDLRATMSVVHWRTLFADPSLGMQAVNFSYPRPRSTTTHERVLGTRNLRFSQPRLSIEVDRQLWKARIPSADEARFACLLASSEAAARAHEAGPLEQRVEDLLMQWLRTNPGAEQVAERLGLSVRTLHRQLSARGSSFRGLLERTRRRELELVQQTEQLHAASAGGPALAAGERARMLGFSNAGALRNALRRWAGRS